MSSSIPRVAYLVRRTTRGTLPVYSDIARTHIRNVDGRVDLLAQDLRQSLFDPDTPHAKRLAVRVHHHRHIVLSGGRFKQDVMAWLVAKGF